MRAVGWLIPERGEPEVAGLSVEERAENAGRVETRDAEPADASVRRDERAGVTVGQEGLVGDRRERRQRGRALCLLRRGGTCVLTGVLHALDRHNHRPLTTLPPRTGKPTVARTAWPHPALMVGDLGSSVEGEARSAVSRASCRHASTASPEGLDGRR